MNVQINTFNFLKRFHYLRACECEWMHFSSELTALSIVLDIECFRTLIMVATLMI